VTVEADIVANTNAITLNKTSSDAQFVTVEADIVANKTSSDAQFVTVEADIVANTNAITLNKTSSDAQFVTVEADIVANTNAITLNKTSSDAQFVTVEADIVANTNATSTHTSNASLHREIDDVFAPSTTTLLSSKEISDRLVLKLNANERSAANGVAALDSMGKVPYSQMPINSLEFQGTWDACMNTPEIVSGVGTQGHFYIVSTSSCTPGDTNIDGESMWELASWILFTGTVWQKIQHFESVKSVNGANGIITLDTDDIAQGTTNLYYTDAKVINAMSPQVSTITSNISVNTAKVGYTDSLVDANSNVTANTVKVGYTDTLVNSNSNVTVNTAKVGYTDALVNANSNVTANTVCESWIH
jgi:hypothetical protein